MAKIFFLICTAASQCLACLTSWPALEIELEEEELQFSSSKNKDSSSGSVMWFGDASSLSQSSLRKTRTFDRHNPYATPQPPPTTTCSVFVSSSRVAFPFSLSPTIQNQQPFLYRSDLSRQRQQQMISFGPKLQVQPCLVQQQQLLLQYWRDILKLSPSGRMMMMKMLSQEGDLPPPIQPFSATKLYRGIRQHH
ncbi:PREDICTED: ethylene-responsive transcription factor ERF053-like [Camelina sativa]|uniref:Ethylene-responsive transcription factor ERF053-like n=1 Tax=Camelina sativa TaxID=90675 RepID=A0ABM0WBQ3_CAMSA|nr:PREDICTED: ethylene-responsive transcription factor ERF053-like [Camelina sativa]